jgi:hypothetical protein
MMIMISRIIECFRDHADDHNHDYDIYIHMHRFLIFSAQAHCMQPLNIWFVFISLQGPEIHTYTWWFMWLVYARHEYNKNRSCLKFFFFVAYKTYTIYFIKIIQLHFTLGRDYISSCSRGQHVYMHAHICMHVYEEHAYARSCILYLELEWSRWVWVARYTRARASILILIAHN